MESIKEKISSYLNNHRKMTLATVNSSGQPMSHTVEYVSNGHNVYFATKKTTRKIQNIQNNRLVGLAVDEDYDDWMKIQGVQLEGAAAIVEDQEKLNKILQSYIEKFPFVADFPPNPDLIFVEIIPKEGYFLDYEQGFTHRDKVTF